MAIEKTIKLLADTKDANKGIDEIAKSLNDVNDVAEESEKSINSVGKAAKNQEKAVKGLGTSVRAVGAALKAIGIGLVIALVAKMGEVFSKNQKVVDFFSTSMETLNIVFGDLFNFISDNLGTFTGFFKDLFENPLENIKEFGRLIKENIIERFNSALEVAGFLGTALKKLFTGDFEGALDSVKQAGIEFVDVLTGVDDSVEKITDGVTNLIEKGSEYLSQTIEQAAANTQLANSAEIAAASQARLVEQFDRQAEKQRQIRDDESKSIESRKVANDELGRILEEQEKAMLRQANLQVAAAQAQLNTNDNIENQVALINALANAEGVLAQVEGFRSEQIVNRIALKKEEIELDNTVSDAEKERQLAQLEFEESQAIKEEEKLELSRERLELENQILIDDLERKRLIYAEGTQARVDAEQEFLTRKQELDNELIANTNSTNEIIKKDNKSVENSKIQLAGQALSIIGGLAEKNSKLAKGVAVAQATMNTYQGITAAYAQTTDATPTQSMRFINAAAIGVAGLANVSKILATKPVSTTPASISSGSPASAPSFNLVEGSENQQIADGIDLRNTTPTRAFVVSGDVTTAQSEDRNIVTESGL
tara:strand:- start:389 stop:2182 length:1794 start_codon:yes stop_codon:yes gene_type:complete